jgi:ketosteroid isomerase-like protein
VANLTESDVLSAVDRLVAAFAATDTAEYFGCFDPSATFVFPDVPHRLEGRSGYEALWRQWLDDGWRVEECESSDRYVQLRGGTAIVTHAVRTVVSVNGSRSTSHERESIVFCLDAAGDLVALHEHLSTAPPPEGHDV